MNAPIGISSNKWIVIIFYRFFHSFAVVTKRWLVVLNLDVKIADNCIKKFRKILFANFQRVRYDILWSNFARINLIEISFNSWICARGGKLVLVERLGDVCGRTAITACGHSYWIYWPIKYNRKFKRRVRLSSLCWFLDFCLIDGLYAKVLFRLVSSTELVEQSMEYVYYQLQSLTADYLEYLKSKSDWTECNCTPSDNDICTYISLFVLIDVR